MSNAHSGGSILVDGSVPQTEQEVLSLLKQYLRSELSEDAVDYVTRNDENRIILFDKELDLPPYRGESVVSGAFIHPADHPVQTVWENRFEVQYDKDTDRVWVVVSDNYGTAQETWERKVEQQDLNAM